jgi:hypothetical protein
MTILRSPVRVFSRQTTPATESEIRTLPPWSSVVIPFRNFASGMSAILATFAVEGDLKDRISTFQTENEPGVVK